MIRPQLQQRLWKIQSRAESALRWFIKVNWISKRGGSHHLGAINQEGNNEHQRISLFIQRYALILCQYAQLLQLELQIKAENIETKLLRQKLRFAWTELLDYQECEAYVDSELVKSHQSKAGSGHKGLWYFPCEVLQQRAFYVTAQFYQIRGHLLEGEIGACLYIARYYYQQAIRCSLITQVEHSLLKRIIGKLASLNALAFSNKKVIESSYRLMQKFAIKQRSIQVVLELSNADSAIHETILSFVKFQIFEKLSPSDHFSLTTLRSGSQPFVSLPLEQKGFNTKFKRQQLNELYSVSPCPQTGYASRSLGQALRACLDAWEGESCSRVFKKGKTYRGPIKWMIAFVGPQRQDLIAIQSRLERLQCSLENINLIIIGLRIEDPELCCSYRELCHLTPEGHFVNLEPLEHEMSYFFQDNKQAERENIIEVLSLVEASIQLFDSKREPFIVEKIDFN
ncbi:hypothetical protein FGO68_gene15360 [Halteria grandinella]|uniref:Uncharacterized protein n=1 Tax=Halteria grandinella TaxID=5974 RepID=A0A8J8T7Z0_HALGN|nr:hypothetical protein FGO68_gene15360 [Halteria grandinella]